MSELQTENESVPTELITPEAAPTDTGTVTSGSESATDTGEVQEQTNQDAVNKAIGKQHAKYREEQRLRQTSDNALAEANRKLAEFEANKPAPLVPEMPDPYEDGFEEKMRIRDAAIVAKASSDAQQATAVTNQQAQQATAQQAQVEADKAAVATYKDKATTLGVDSEVLVAAETAVVNYGIQTDQLQFIIGKDDGPLIMQHLAANPMDLDDLSRMTPFQAATFINSTLSTKAAALKPKQSTAPAPLEPLSGNGVDPNGAKSPWLEGGTYN